MTKLRLEDLLMNDEVRCSYNDANDYFKGMVEKVFVARANYFTGEDELIPFNGYTDIHYCDSSFYYSAYALMGLTNNDKVVRGEIDKDELGSSNYLHGWVEFTYNDREYVYDCLLSSVVDKETYYQYKSPVVKYSSTLDEVLDFYTKYENCFFVNGDEYFVKSFLLSFDRNSVDESGLLVPMSNAEITYDSEKRFVKKFVAHENGIF